MYLEGFGQCLLFPLSIPFSSMTWQIFMFFSKFGSAPHILVFAFSVS